MLHRTSGISRPTSWLILVAAAAAVVQSSAAAAVSTIYFNGPPGAVYQVNPDGTGRIALFGFSAPGNASAICTPSTALHAGQRWFLLGPDASLSISFISQTSVTVVCPVNWGDIDTRAYDLYIGPGGYIWDLTWVPGDAEVSFVGRRIDGSGNVIETGVYALSVSYDASGIPTAVGSPHLKFATTPVSDPDYGLISPVGGSDNGWNPSGTALTFLYHVPNTASNPTQLCTLDSAGIHVIYNLSTGFTSSPSWGVGNKIAFTCRTSSTTSALYSISSTGGSLKLLDSAKDASQAYFGFRQPQWSPDGSSVAYNFTTNNSRKGTITSTLRRVSSSGGSYTTIVDLGNWISATGWR